MKIYSASDKLKCIKRELAMRERVYPRWVQQNKITQNEANEQIAIMKEIQADYELLEGKERLI